MAQPFSVIAVIVTYNAGADFRQNLTAILPQVSHTVIVDNGSSAATVQVLKELAGNHSAITLILNSQNKGLAAAQNQGIQLALEKCCDFILLLDDDSQAQPGMVEAQLEAYLKYSPGGRVGLVAPNYEDINIEEPARYLTISGLSFRRVCFRPGDEVLEVLLAFASGSLIPAAALKDVGLMREDFFVHFIDTEFNLRLRRKGYRIIAVQKAHMRHRLGARTEHSFLGRRVTTTNHPPEARYYQCRNRVLVAREYFREVPGYLIFDFARAGLEILRVLMFEQNKFAKFAAMFRGYVDGALGRSGGLTAPPEARPQD